MLTPCTITGFLLYEWLTYIFKYGKQRVDNLEIMWTYKYFLVYFNNTSNNNNNNNCINFGSYKLWNITFKKKNYSERERQSTNMHIVCIAINKDPLARRARAQ